MTTERETLSARIDDYGERAEILRQIHSDRALAHKRLNDTLTIATIIVAASLAFLGFTGVQKFHSLLALIGVYAPLNVFEFAFSVLVFLILLLTILGLVFRFQDKAAAHHRAIVMLTGFLRDLEDRRALPTEGAGADQELERTRERYKFITEVLPPSTDKDFLRSKRKYIRKKEKSRALETQQGGRNWLKAAPREPAKKDPVEAEGTEKRLLEAARPETRLGPEAQVKELIARDDWRMEVLKAVKSVSKPICWVSGGFVRNKVWDTLHNYRVNTPLDDVDVIYYDPSDASEAADTKLEQRLRQLLPNVPWSVKNQARMHTITGDPQYTSMRDALEKWPETATAVAVRLEPDDSLSFLAPHGFDDLLGLKVCPSAHFRKHPARYEERLRGKNWSATWPKLSVEHLKINSRPVHPFEEVLPSVFKVTKDRESR